MFQPDSQFSLERERENAKSGFSTPTHDAERENALRRLQAPRRKNFLPSPLHCWRGECPSTGIPSPAATSRGWPTSWLIRCGEALRHRPHLVSAARPRCQRCSFSPHHRRQPCRELSDYHFRLLRELHLIQKTHAFLYVVLKRLEHYPPTSKPKQLHVAKRQKMVSCTASPKAGRRESSDALEKLQSPLYPL